MTDDDLVTLKLRIASCIKELAAEQLASQEVIEGVPRITELLSEGFKDPPTDMQTLVGADTQNRWVRIIKNLYKGQDIVVDRPIVYQKENIQVQCHPDVLAPDAVWEIKSVHPNRYLYARVKPFRRDLEQVLVYLEATGREVGYLVYEDRASLEYTIHRIYADPTAVSEILDKLPLIVYGDGGGDERERVEGFKGEGDAAPLGKEETLGGDPGGAGGS